MQIPKRKKAKQFQDTRLDMNISQERFDKLNSELDKLKNIVQPKLAVEVQQLAEMGDFSENAGYQIAKGRLRYVNQKILEIADVLKNAKIICPDEDSCIIALGHKVTVENNGKEMTFQILGSSETNPSANIISHNSPLGSALIGKAVGNEVSFNNNVYRVLEIK